MPILARYWLINDIEIDNRMKKTIIFALALMLSFVAFSQKDKKPKRKKHKAKVEQTNRDTISNLVFESTIHDFGKIPQGKPVTYVFTFVNKNANAVIINDAHASCGCTTPQWTHEPIPAGGVGTISATFNAASNGYFNKTITVKTNLGNISLQITGVVYTL